jgi:hypothetical protein
MKATITLCALLGLGVVVLVLEPAALAAGIVASNHTIGTDSLEPAWMVFSGASLLAVASLVRRYIP